ncbi:glycosyltransferase family 4 protein [Jatrophihabitans sp.]|uniref:glycosyltransferase family 4 protein n=1 Tax=Jatrophihabitans sp. TaxID=1932789 RepID=UPI0030C6CAD7|nr:glycosyltransferase [Jatrophihabitans sp.]
MRILLCAQFYPPINGGEERHVRNLALAMFGRGHDVDVLTIAADATAVGDTDEDGVRVVRVASTASRFPILYSDHSRPHSLPVSDPAVRRAASRLLDESDYDVVHAHNWIVSSVLEAADERGVPVIQTLHDYSHVCAIKRYMRDGAECAGPSVRRCATCASGHYGLGGIPIAAANRLARGRRNAAVSEFLAVSSAVALRNQLAEGSTPFQVIPNFIPDAILEDADAIAGPARAQDPLVFVGDLSRDKGVDVLLAAYARLADPPPLLLAGRVADAELTLPPGARVLAELSHPAVLALMRTARCVVVPSVWPDPCPTVVLEAMALGRPVLAAASGGILDMVEHGRTGYLVPPGDAAALTAGLRGVIADPVRAHRVGLAGREAVVAFTDGRVVPLIESVYRDHSPISTTTMTKSHHFGGRH